MKKAPDKCPFCESPILVHGGNPLKSENGGFATYECKSVQDIIWSDAEFKRAAQSEVCRRREVIFLTRKLDEANNHIKQLEAFVNRFLDPEDLGYAVNKCFRDDAREALGRNRVESPSKKNKP